MSLSNIHVVKSGDTLGKIAKIHQTSVLELTQLNGIRNPDRISVGQKIQLPKPLSQVQPGPKLSEEEDDDWGSIVFQLVDAINRPIEGLKVKIEAFGKFFETKTDDKGVVPAVAVKKGELVKLHVERVEGGMKHVATVKPDGAAQHARIISPKVAVKSLLRRHEGPSVTPMPPEPRPLGEERSTRSAAGNPVHEVAMECPNPQNLKLVANFKYRNIVIAAAARANIVPQSVAAIMNAEAAKIPKRYIIKPVIDFVTKQPKLRKNGKLLVTKSKDPSWLEGEWDARSASPKSSARGMTQFLDASWLDQACIEGTFLNAKAKKEGWLTKAPVDSVKAGKTVRRILDSFVLADGTRVTASRGRSLARVLSDKPYLIGRATASDANLQALLDLRFEPEYAIHTAVDYGIQNMAGLKKSGYVLDGLNDGEKAKVIYLCHHLGIGDAKLFINNIMTATRAQGIFEKQIGVKPAAFEAKVEGGNYLAAHRKWLDMFINEKVIFKDFICSGDALQVRTLFALCEAMKKKSKQ